MPELRTVETDPERFIRLPDGTIYGYTSMLAKRRDATIVDGYAAAQWFKSQGVENEVTRRFVATAPLDQRPAPKPAPARKPNRNVVKEAQRTARTTKLAERAEKLKRMKEAKPEPPAAQETSEAVEEETPLDKTIGDLLDGKDRR